MKIDYKGKETNDIYFPINGPYCCELCESIWSTNKEFLDHVNADHLGDVDEEILKKMEIILNALKTT
jgi:hypothetical protein